MTDFDKGLEAQESSHAVAAKWKILNTLYVVVALKRENTQFTAEKYLEFLAKRIMSCML